MNGLVSRLLLPVALFLVAACIGDSPSPPKEVAGPTDPFGYYLLDPEKPRPRWAESIDHLHLSTIDMKGGQMVTVPLWGLIRPRSGDDLRLVEAKMRGDHLTFATQEVREISYEFDGRFLASGNFPETPPEGVVLRGRLRRRIGGQGAGEMEADFVYTAGD